jgi:hypothetical protein
MKRNFENEEEKLRSSLEKNKNPFSVPGEYFENLSGKIMDKVRSLPDYETSADYNPFNVPDDYFEKLPSIISDKIASKKAFSSQGAVIFSRPRIVIPIAFATIIILAGIFLFKQRNHSDNTQQEFTIDDLKNSTYIQSMDEDIFVDVLSSQKESVQDESIEQYLIDNNIDLSQIENKL